MQIYLSVRRTLDWEDEGHVEANILPSFRSRFELWNATFEMPYAAFRARLKAIADQNLAQVDDAQVADLDAKPGPDALVVPIDDDDWLAPDLARRIREALARNARGREPAGVYWVREVISPPRRRRKLRRWLRPLPRRGRWTCYTNNYALRGDLPDLVQLGRSHVEASHFFETQPERVLRIPRLLAIQNRNLASQTALGWRRPSIDRPYLLARYAAYRRFYRGWRVRRGLRWAQPCIDEMSALMEELRVRPEAARETSLAGP